MGDFLIVLVLGGPCCLLCYAVYGTAVHLDPSVTTPDEDEKKRKDREARQD